MQLEDGSLNFLATPPTLGLYFCQAVENNFTQTLAVYQVKQRSNPTAPPADPSRPQVTRSPDRGPTGTSGTTKGATATQAREMVRKTPEQKLGDTVLYYFFYRNVSMTSI